MDLRERRELNNGAGDALNRAMELVVTPMIFGGFGYLIDGKLGTRPLFMLVFFMFVLGYIVWKNFTVYKAAVDREQHRMLYGDSKDTS